MRIVSTVRIYLSRKNRQKQRIRFDGYLVRSVIDVCEAVNLGAKEGTQLYNALDDARQYFEKMKNDPDYNFASEYDEDIDYELQRIANKFKNNGNSIYDLSSADLDEVYDAMKMVYKTIRRATELIRKEGETNARKAAERVIHEVRSAKGVSSFMSTHKVIRKFPEFTLKSLIGHSVGLPDMRMESLCRNGVS